MGWLDGRSREEEVFGLEELGKPFGWLREMVRGGFVLDENMMVI